MKTLGIVIFYYPTDEVWKNIASYIDLLDKLIIWNNTPGNQLDLHLPTWEEKIVLMGVGKNLGIGKALNKAILYAKENQYDYLLTMDQDSHFVKEGLFSPRTICFMTKHCIHL